MNVVHAAPIADSRVLACCGATMFELAADRVTEDPHLVTCGVVLRRAVFAKSAPRRLLGWSVREDRTGRLLNWTLICELCGDRWTVSCFGEIDPKSFSRDFAQHRRKRACIERWRKRIVRIGPNPIGLAFGKEWPDRFRRLSVDARRVEIRRLCERLCKPEGGGVCELHGGMHR